MGLTVPALRALRDRLATAFAPVDAEFVAAGDQLSHAIGWLDGIRDGLGGLQRALDGADVAAAIGTLDAAAGAIGTLAASFGGEEDRLATLEAKLRAVGGSIAAITEVNRGLTLLAFNAAIVSSGIAEDGEDIVNFAAEIRSLLQASEQVMRGYARSHDGALRQLGQTAAAYGAFRRQQGALLQDVAACIQRSLGEVAARQLQARRAAAELQGRAESIAGAIGTSVAALQVGDATRQRIEHVVDGLTALAEGLDGADRPWCAGLPPLPRDALAGRGLALQAALLDAAGEAFGAGIARISSALAQLAVDARAMVASGAALFGRNGASDGSFLSALEHELNRASTLLSEAAARRDEVDHAMAAIDGMMNQLRDGLHAVRGAATDLRLVGLNAAFRCARLGPRGMALAAIARELRAQAWQMSDGVETLSAAVERALEAGAAIHESGGRAGAQALAETNRAMHGSLAVLRAVGGVMDATIGHLGEDGHRAANALTAMAAGLSEVSELTTCLAGIADLMASVPDLQGEASASLLRERLGLVNAATFTMEEERSIARDFGAALPEPVAAEIDDILF